MLIKMKAHLHLFRNSLLIVFAACFFSIINYYYIGMQMTNMHAIAWILIPTITFHSKVEHGLCQPSHHATLFQGNLRPWIELNRMPLADHWCVKANFGDNTESAVQFWLIVATYILVWCIRNVMHHWSRAEYRSSEQQQLHKFHFVVLDTNTTMGEFMEKVSTQLEQKKNNTMTTSETKSNMQKYNFSRNWALLQNKKRRIKMAMC